MIKIKNYGYKQFKEYIKDKTVYIFGAGRALESCLDLYFEKQCVEKIIDNNEKLLGNKIKHRDDEITIIGINQFIEEFQQIKEKSKVTLMISSPIYAGEIIEMLDGIDELDGLECFLQVLIRNTKEEIKDYDFTQGETKIPKKIHYIWIGGKPLPYEFEKNIDSWMKYNCDYEIIRWDESNYNFEKDNYVREAYESKEWSFASNYARLDIVYQQGGIYLDTDVEAIKKFDELLRDEAFINMGSGDRINLGCGFGAVKGHPMIKDMLTVFKENHFLTSDGKPAKKPFHSYIHPIVRKYGFEICNEYQKQNNIVLYPTEVMSPLTIEGMEDYLSEKTISIHKEVGTWRNEKEREGMKKIKHIVDYRLR